MTKKLAFNFFVHIIHNRFCLFSPVSIIPPIKERLEQVVQKGGEGEGVEEVGESEVKERVKDPEKGLSFLSGRQ